MYVKAPDKYQLYSNEDAAKLLGITGKALSTMRWKGLGPAFVKMGRRIMYRYGDLVNYIDKRVVK